MIVNKLSERNTMYYAALQEAPVDIVFSLYELAPTLHIRGDWRTGFRNAILLCYPIAQKRAVAVNKPRTSEILRVVSGTATWHSDEEIRQLGICPSALWRFRRNSGTSYQSTRM